MNLTVNRKKWPNSKSCAGPAGWKACSPMDYFAKDER